MASETDQSDRRVPALRFKQWLEEWNDFDYRDEAHGRRPKEHLYMFSMRAAELRQLCDVYRRQRDGANAEGIQRARDASRTGRIQRYVRHGYPYGDLRPGQRTPEMMPLRKPGWLPTAIVVNILTENDVRRGLKVDAQHLVRIEEDETAVAQLVLPSQSDLFSADLAPLEVIDGQHRLWAFEDGTEEEPVPDDFELPVVAFHGLDVAWQAYLFWSINVSPKKINPSHAFDLYPLLRTQEWLDQVGELTVYREARAQELTELIYIHPASPWQGRINMLGERGGPGVSQSAWVQGLSRTFFGTGKGSGRPGLFQANIERDEEPLGWTRPQQAAFLIQLWADIKEAVLSVRLPWIAAYKGKPEQAFSNKNSLLNQDMGVRAVLTVVNELFFDNAWHWRLGDWRTDGHVEGETTVEDVTAALVSLQNTHFRPMMRQVAAGLVDFDWRSLDGPGVQDDPVETVTKRSYRGSGGYSALTSDVMKTLADSGQNLVASAASHLIQSAT